MIMFADIPAITGHEILTWLGVLAFLMLLANQALGLFDRVLDRKRQIGISGQPIKVQPAKDFALADDCQQRHDTLDNALAELRKQRAEDVRDNAVSRKSIYEQIGAVRSEMALMERRLSVDDELRTQKVHDRVNEVLSAVSRLDGKLEGRS